MRLRRPLFTFYIFFALQSVVFADGSAENRVKKELSPVEKALEAVRLGEKALSSPYSFTDALAHFDQARKLDVTNIKAKVYRSVLSPLMALEGFFTRLSQMVEKEALGELLSEATYQWEKHHPNVQRMTFRFLFSENVSQFKTISELQDFLKITLLPKLRESQKNLSEIKIKEGDALYLNISSWREPQIEQTLKLETIDLYAIKTLFHGIEVFIRLFTAYDLDFSPLYYKKVNAGELKTLKDKVDYIKTIPKALVLKEGDQKNLRTLMDDVGRTVEALRYLGTVIQKKEKPWKGKNSYSVSDYLSLSLPEYSKDFISLSNYLSGPTVVKIKEDLGYCSRPPKEAKRGALVLINPVAWLFSPPKDLKGLFPIAFDETGEIAVKFSDNTLNRLNPNGESLHASLLFRRFLDGMLGP